MPRLQLIIILAALGLASSVSAECFEVDVGFVRKPCGNIPTKEELAQFFATQAAQVAQLKQTNPCGFTTCPRMKRDVEFSYSEVEKRQGSLLADSVPVGSDSSGALYQFGAKAPAAPLTNKRQANSLLADSVPVGGDSSGAIYQFGAKAPSAPLTNKRDSDLTEDELIARNLPVMRGADGKLALFDSRSIPSIAEPDAGESISKREPVPAKREIMEGAENLSEAELIARNLPVMRGPDGQLRAFGTRS